MKRYCYWSVADGSYAEMFKTTIKSARSVGVETDFHVWTDRVIPDAVNHKAGDFDKKGWFFKFTFLRDAVQKLDYEYFVWLDTDTYFVRNPGNVLDVMHGSPIHVSLECDVLSPKNTRLDWWGCPNSHFASLMREMGVKHREIYNVNGGLVIVHREAVETVFRLAMDFYAYCFEKSVRFVDEPLWAYVMHMLCADVKAHTLDHNLDLWASDWAGEFSGRLPDSHPWWFTNYFTGEKKRVNPAIVHAMRSKDALLAAARS